MDGEFFGKWSRELALTANLEEARSQLDGQSGYFARGMRGRMSSLLMETQRADSDFRLSNRLSGDEEPTESLARRLSMIHCYWVENDILRGDIKDSDTWKSPVTLLRVCDEAFRRVATVAIACQARALMEEGDDAEAFALLDVAAEGPASHANLALWKTGRACAAHNLGDHTARDLSLDAAEFHSSLAENVLEKTFVTARMRAIFKILGDKEKAEEYTSALYSLPIPERTLRAALSRSSLMVARCLTRGRLVTV